jgi:hypothetical protein
VTAIVVNGLEVIADEPTEAPLCDRSGKPLVWRQTRTLLLSDGSTVYGCVHCDYSSPNVKAIRPHLNKHRTSTVDVGRLDELSLGEVLRRLAALDDLTAERDGWRERATRAERSLSNLRRALRGVAP